MNFKKRQREFVSKLFGVMLLCFVILAAGSFGWYIRGIFASPAGEYVEMEKVITNELWYGTENRTDLLAYPEQTASCIIFKSGSTFYAKNGTTQAIMYTDTNASAVINNVLSDMSYKGLLFININGDISLSAPISIIGKGSVPDSYELPCLTIQCLGQRVTNFKPAVNINAFEIKNRAMVNIKDFSIQLPDNTAGHGIAGLDTGANTVQSMSMSRFENFMIYGGTGGTHWCVYIKQAYGVQLKNFRLFARGAGGIRYENTQTPDKTGDTELTSGYNTIYVRKNNGIGIDILGNTGATQGHIILNGYNYIQGGVAGEYTGTIGLHLKLTEHGIIHHLTVEYISSCIKLEDNAYGYTFNGKYLQPMDGGKGIEVVDTSCNENIFRDFTIFAIGGYSITDITDVVTSTQFPNIFSNIYLRGSGTHSISKTSASIFDNLFGYLGKSENTVTFSSISNGTYVAHGLFDTPATVVVTLTVQGYAWVGAKNSTHVQLYFNTATSSGLMRCEIN